MYLAPFNYDRFFERVFKHTHIAKRFLEDILGVTIEEITPLPRKNKITDDAAFVEFDYRCKIDGTYVIIDMQQWYKDDVIKRFFLYFCNNTSLQLEKLKTTTTPIVKKKVNKSKNYDDLEPAITLVWMADDNLGFEDDIIAFTMLPEIFTSFINDKALWENPNIDDIRTYREKVLSIANNDTKNLSFLAKNRLIFALQPDIVKNHRTGKNVKLDKYVNWFLFAQKTKNKDNKAEDFETFKNEPIFMEVIEILKTSDLSQDDWQYITDYEAYEEGLKNYNEKILKKGGIDFKRIQQMVIHAEQEKKQAEQEKIQAEQAILFSIEKLLAREVPLTCSHYLIF